MHPRLPPLEMSGQAVAWHHIEASARQQDDAGLPCRRIESSEALEDGDLAGDVDVVSPAREACRHERICCFREGTGKVQDRRHVFDGAPYRRWILQTEGRPWCLKASRERAYLALASAGERRRLFGHRRRMFRNQRSGVPRCSIDQQVLHWHVHPLSAWQGKLSSLDKLNNVWRGVVQTTAAAKTE